VQEKIEKLIDKHMLKLGTVIVPLSAMILMGLGASKVSLSSITSELLWKKSGRFDTNSNSEVGSASFQRLDLLLIVSEVSATECSIRIWLHVVAYARRRSDNSCC